jgi:phosphate transport system substrate-binding protein
MQTKRKISKVIFIVLAAALTMIMCVGLAACNVGGEKDILVVSREDGSGTRDAFDSLIQNDEGLTLKKSEMTSSAEILSKTGDVMIKVASVKSAIGYISLGSLDDSVKALKIDGVTPSAQTVKNDTYKLWRPFVIMTNKAKTEGDSLTAATKDFMLYLASSDAQVVASDSYVSVDSVEDYSAPFAELSGTVIIRGSTSVEPLMNKLIADYLKIGGGKVSKINFDMQCQGSSYGLSAVKADTTGNVIGLSSTAVKTADESEIAHFDVALDAIAIIVNKENSLEKISIADLYKIYTGSVSKFSEL